MTGGLTRVSGAARGVALGLGLVLAAAASGQSSGQTAPNKAPAKKAAPAPPPALPKDPKAIEILKAACDKLAEARSMSFTALGAYEVPSLLGPPLIYGRIYEVQLQRPSQLAVITVADGPRSEFYDDGKVMMSFHPAENLVAVTEAPPTIDAALEKIYSIAGTYFPFTDIVVANPWKDLESGLTTAFYVGSSQLVGGVTTDVVAYESFGVFVQMWIGADDKLPRMARAQYHDDPLQLRQSVQFTNWQINPTIADGTFTSAKASGADKIAFNHPKMKSDLPADVKPIGPGTKPPKLKATPKPQ